MQHLQPWVGKIPWDSLAERPWKQRWEVCGTCGVLAAFFPFCLCCLWFFLSISEALQRAASGAGCSSCAAKMFFLSWGPLEPPGFHHGFIF